MEATGSFNGLCLFQLGHHPERALQSLPQSFGRIGVQSSIAILIDIDQSVRITRLGVFHVEDDDFVQACRVGDASQAQHMPETRCLQARRQPVPLGNPSSPA